MCRRVAERTLTVIVHVVPGPAASVPAVSDTVALPATALSVPPQVFVAAGAGETTTGAGSGSLSASADSATAALFVMTSESVLSPPICTDAGVKVLTTVGAGLRTTAAEVATLSAGFESLGEASVAVLVTVEPTAAAAVT